MIKVVNFLIVLILILASCNSKPTLFKKIESSESNVHFRNDILENDSVNIIDQENIYNGGGVGIGDFNNDGKPDLFFTGNMVSDKMYLNKGDLKFVDITSVAGVGGEGKWSRGVSIVDINNDGWQDIYISCTMLKDSSKRENILYINQGLNKDGIPFFKDLAKEYGLNDNSFTTQSAFFDYDNDGDLDVYLGVNVFAKRDNPNVFRRKFLNGEHPNTDRLFRNDWDSVLGHPVFKNVSREAGILQDGYAHSVTICDINQDGYKDIFVANDYLSEDFIYVNNHNGTFTNRSKEYLKHTAYNAMGSDVVDLNNDGLSDIIELDMNPEDNYRKKTMLGGENYQSYLYNNNYDYQYQYIRNNFHLNMGNSMGANDSINHPVFSEISFLSGIAETDWSWCPLVADFDNDGYKDLIITNGFPKDVTDHDFMMYRNSAFALNDKVKLLSQIPQVKISNYAYHNNGNLKFTDVTKDWGFDLPTFSNGAATVDLDNDGDLDVVINNINEEASIYENKLNNTKDHKQHYVEIELDGASSNKGAFGSWLKIYYAGNKQQVFETNPVRGYLSSNQNMVFFGLDSINKVDSLVVIWPNNQTETFQNIRVDQKHILHQSTAKNQKNWNLPSTINVPLFREVSDSLNLNYVHYQKDFNDFGIQRLLPHKFSQEGPSIAVGDINGDGFDDMIVGSSNGMPERVFTQQLNGKFTQKDLFKITADTLQAVIDQGLQLVDIDKDGDLDLYIAVGGFEEKAGSALYQDKIFLNDGKGNFTKVENLIPINHTSKSCVIASDFDKDGDVDFFIGGRVEPGKYPQKVSSIILRNDSKNGIIHFSDVTKEIAPELENIGLVTDARWVDFNNDGTIDLILSGEWMPISFFKNEKGKFKLQIETGIQDKVGWWNTLTVTSNNKNSLPDFVVGNLGGNTFFSNNQYPITSYYADFDNNGLPESILTKYLKDQKGIYKEYTIHSRDEIVDQLPFIKKNHLSYKSFAETPFTDLFDKTILNKAYKVQANYFSSSYIQNLGAGKFNILPLPIEAQFSTVNSILQDDFDKDGIQDLLIIGNNFGAEVFNGRIDASNGLLLKGKSNGLFTSLSIEKSGIYVPGDAKSLVKLKTVKGNYLYVSAENRGRLRAFVLNKP